jgi:hypothetical protein
MLFRDFILGSWFSETQQSAGWFDPDDSAASGTISGTLGATESADVAAFTASVQISGSLAATEPVDTAALTSQVQVAASFALTEAKDTASFSSALWVSGSLSANDAVDGTSIALELSGGADLSASLAASEAPDIALFNSDSGQYQSQFAGGFPRPVIFTDRLPSIDAVLGVTETPDVCRMRVELSWADDDEDFSRLTGSRVKGFDSLRYLNE